ncbi:MAG: hypothetical protein JWO17_124 [Actinomycetia bacterium]|nr:hypothetical protein [Actinomycetes bacterium]
MRTIGLLAVAVLLLSACGGAKPHPSPTRGAVSAYITRVDNIEFEMQKPLNSIAVATSSYAQGRPAVKTAAAFATAEITLLDLYSRLILVTPPPPARKLHELVLRLVHRQAALAGDLHDLVSFNPAFVKTLQPLVAANAAARRALRSSKKRSLVAQSVHAFRVSIDDVSRHLHSLHPPAVERPLFDAQVARLAALSASLTQLEDAIRANDPTAIARFQHAVSVASVSSDTRANQLAEREAVLTYNERVASVKTLAQQTMQERDHLQLTLR